MKKRELLERIEQLEQRIQELEVGEFRAYPPVFVPFSQQCTCGCYGSGVACPVHGPASVTTTGRIGAFSSSYVGMSAEELAKNSTPTRLGPLVGCGDGETRVAS